MSRKALTLETCGRLVRELESVIKKSMGGRSVIYYTGAGLGTAYMVVSVLDEDLRLVADSYRYADVVRDGMVMDYIGAIRIVREVREELKKKLGTELIYAAAAIPPDTSALDSGAIKNVVQSAGSEITVLPNEPTAAGAVLNIRSGTVVGTGGGTTGISMLRDGKVVYVADEPTDGVHFSLVISGTYQLSSEETDAYKQGQKNHRELLLVLKPVIEEVPVIISHHIEGRDVDGIYLVGGTCCLTGVEGIMGRKTGIPTYKSANPMFVVLLGIAKNCANACG